MRYPKFNPTVIQDSVNKGRIRAFTGAEVTIHLYDYVSYSISIHFVYCSIYGGGGPSVYCKTQCFFIYPAPIYLVDLIETICFFFFISLSLIFLSFKSYYFLCVQIPMLSVNKNSNYIIKNIFDEIIKLTKKLLELNHVTGENGTLSPKWQLLRNHFL